jgi:glycosyltransferase involved in cell wall biosynthesis
MSRRVDFPISSSLRYRWFADRIICVSRAVARVCEDGGVPAKQLAVVYDGVDPRRMSVGDPERGRRALDLNANQFLLLTVAALSDHKGHRFLLNALPLVLERHPQTVVAFAGEGELEQTLRAQVSTLGLNDRVRFLGFRSDVADLIRAADLFVMPSRLEGLCSTLIDVMLAGTPIVATTAGGIPEVLVDASAGPTAWLVPPENPGELAKAIITVLADTEARTKYVAAARQRALQNFTAETMVERTIAVYEEGLRAVEGRIAK